MKSNSVNRNNLNQGYILWPLPPKKNPERDAMQLENFYTQARIMTLLFHSFLCAVHKQGTFRNVPYSINVGE